MVTGKYIETEEGEKTTFGYCCKFNEGVGCHPMKHHCESCVWNPEVAKKRLHRICAEMGVDVPKEYQ